MLMLLPALFIQYAVKSQVAVPLIELIKANLFLYLLAIASVKAISIIYPPLPGVAFTLASIPLIGWERAYVLDIIGSVAGASASYFLGKTYGVTILNRVLGHSLTAKIAQVTLKPINQIEAAVMLRLAAGGLLSDGLAWGASLIGFRFAPFVIGYTISHLLTTAPVFYALGASLSIDSWVVFLSITAAAWLVIYRFKGRYFE